MAGKEAVVFLVDCNASMGGHMELARKAVRALMVQKMLQSKQTEVGVVLFGLPESETANKLNDEDNNDYLGVKEYCMLDKGGVPVLRRVAAIAVPADADDKEPAMGDLLDAMVVGMHMIRSRTLKKKFLRHVYLLTDAATPVQEASQLPEIVTMYTDATMECRLHFVSFGDGGSAAGATTIKEQNEKMLASVAAATLGTVVSAQTVVDLIGEASIKTTNPVQTKVDLFLGTNLTLHCRYFKKTDTGSKESLKKESIGSYDPAGGSDGKVRVDKTYRDPEMPEVEVDFENQVKGFRYGQDYIPVNTVDEVSLKLPEEPPSLKVIGSAPSSTVRRHFYVDDTFVLVPEPGSGQAAGAIGSLTGALRNLGQVLVVRFVRRKGAEPWLAVLIPDATGVAPAQRLLLQKIPFVEDVRSFNFPSLAKPPPSRKPSEEQRRVSASLVEAMMMPDIDGDVGGVRAGLVLDPVRQGVTRAKVARAMDPECELPEPHPYIKTGVAPAPQLMDAAASALEEYREAFVFEKREKLKGAGKKRMTYFSDLTLAEPEEAPATKSSPSKRGRTEASGGDAGGDGGGEGVSETKKQPAASTAAQKVGSINPVSDFEAMMASAVRGADGGMELADLAVEQMQGVIHTLVRKGTTSSLRAKAVSCVKALRTASVAHIMGKKYNDFLVELKAKYQRGDNSDIWEMVMEEKGAWPITSDDDASLGMTPDQAEGFMKAETVKEGAEEEAEGGGDDDDFDDMA